MRELTSWVPADQVEQKPLTSNEFKKLVNEVQEDQWNGCSNIDRATAARAELFSRLRFPASSTGKPIKL